jgi:protein SCO1
VPDTDQQSFKDHPSPEIVQSISGLRLTLRISGGLLWILVCIFGFRTWQARQQSNEGDIPKGTYSSQKKNPKFVPKPSPPFHAYDAPDFKLISSQEKIVTKNDLLGRPWVVCFTFTRCQGQCQRIESQMHALQDLVAKTDTRLVTISVDPEHDTPEVLRKKAVSWNADPNRWIFLTGNPDDIYRVIGKGFHVTAKQAEPKARRPGFEVTHSHRVLHVNAKGRVVGSYMGTNAVEMAALQRKLLREFRERKQSRSSNNEATKPEERTLPVIARKPRFDRDKKSTEKKREDKDGA